MAQLMDLSDFVDDIKKDEFQKKRELAKRKSYKVLQTIDMDEYGDNLGDVRSQGAFVGEVPSVFVGQSGYPKVNSGILSPLVDDDPSELITNGVWYDSQLSIDDILGRRTSLMNSQKRSETDVYDVWDGYVGVQREVALAKDPVSVDIDIDETSSVKPQLDGISSPTGPSADANGAELTENPSIPRAIKKVEEDDEWKSTEALYYLYNRGFDVYKLQDVFSTGTMGKKENRRLVPTRWSITAIDDTIGKKLRSEINNEASVNDTTVYYNSYIGNDYWVIETPGQWEFELVEIKKPGSVWNPEKDRVSISSAHENYTGRSQYVEETAGAYYASRLGVLENLESRGRQGKYLVIRLVTEDYWAPTGVWQVREAVRNAFNDSSIDFEEFDEAVKSVTSQLPIDKQSLRRNSGMLKAFQRGLDWFSDS